ncbi:hypothetical protein ACO0QE_003083 [Hanseniaspora vineae]
MKKSKIKLPKFKKTLLELNKFGRKSGSTNEHSNKLATTFGLKPKDKQSKKDSKTSKHTSLDSVPDVQKHNEGHHSDSEVVPQAKHTQVLNATDSNRENFSAHLPAPSANVPISTSPNKFNLVKQQSKSPSSSQTSSSSTGRYVELLQKASNSDTTILMELDLEGNIKYISQVWEKIIGTIPEEMIGKPISEFVIGSDYDKSVFERTMELMLEDDSSYRIKFTLEQFTVDKNLVSKKVENILSTQSIQFEEQESLDGTDTTTISSFKNRKFIELEAQGIVITDVVNHVPLHSMWIIKPFYAVDEYDNLPLSLAEKLGFGAIIFQEYLNEIEKLKVLHEKDLPPYKREICRICETAIITWWLESHCSMCLFEHNLYNNISMLHDNLVDNKQILLKIKRDLLALKDFQNSSANISNQYQLDIEPIQYKDIYIDVLSLDYSLIPTLNLFISCCDDAININNSELKSFHGLKLDSIEFDFSPSSKQNIEHVKNWKARLAHLYNGIDSIRLQDLKMVLYDIQTSSELKIVQLERLQNTQKHHLKETSEVTLYTQELVKQKIQSNRLNIPPDIQLSNSSFTPVSDIDFAHTQSQHSNYPISSGQEIDGKMATPAPQKLQSVLFNQAYLQDSNESIPSAVALHSAHSSQQAERVYSPKYSDKAATEHLHVQSTFNGLENSTGSMETASSKSLHEEEHTEPSVTIQEPQAIPQVVVPSGSRPPSLLISNHLLPVPTSSSDDSSTDLGAFAETNKNVAESWSRGSSQNTKSIRRLSTATRYNALASISATPRKGSPLSTGGKLNTPLSVIKKNPTAKSMMEKSPLASPFMPPLESSNISAHQTLASTSDSIATSMQPMSPLLLASESSVLTHRHSSNPHIFDYDIIKPISKGAFGSVFLAKRKLTGEYFAVKALKKSDMILKNQVTNIKEERAIMMSQINKTYTAKLYATFQNKDNLFLVMEYLPGGDLAALIKNVGILPEKWTKQYISEVIYGVDDMHKNGIIHHDLKPDNLLLDIRGHVKFIDFGLSRRGLVNRQRHDSFGSQNMVPSGSPGSQHTHNSLIHSAGISYGDSLRKKTTTDNASYFSLPSANNAPAKMKILESPTQELSSDLQKAFTDNEVLEAAKMQESGSHYTFSVDYGSRSGTPSVTGRKNSGHLNGSDATNSTAISISKGSRGTADGDFVIYDPKANNKQQKFLGTPDYLAPETISGAGESNLCDWWSIGCIFFEFIFAYPPFHASTPTEIFQNILRCDIQWPDFENEEEERFFISAEAKDLIEKLLVLDPSRRLGANGVGEITSHPYFKGFDWSKVYEEEAEFVPNVAHPEDTDYFDPRGATMNIDFHLSDSEDYVSEEPNNALNVDNIETLNDLNGDGYKPDELSNSIHNSSTVINSQNIGSKLEPTSISSILSPAQVGSSENGSISSSTNVSITRRRANSIKLNENQTEFGSFSFKNIVALSKANKDVINRLKTEHLNEKGQHLSSVSASPVSSHLSTQSQSLKNSSFSGLLKNSFSHSPVRRDSAESGRASNHSLMSEPHGDEYNSSSGAPSEVSLSRLGKETGSVNKSSLSRAHSTGRNHSNSLVSLDALSNDEERFDALAQLRILRKQKKKKANRKFSCESEQSSVVKLEFNLDVLVCESIPIHSFFITRNLEQLGCRVIAVDSGDELVRRATSNVKFDIIFSTYIMPTLNCIDLFKLIRNTNGVNCNTPFIVITAYYNEAFKLKLFDEVVEKPATKETMRQLLNKYTMGRVQQCEETLISDVDSEIFYDTT